MLSEIAPGFLLATPALGDPNFAHAVVLMCAHEEGGSLGVVINRPLTIKLETALDQLGIVAPHLPPQKVLLGGPVMPERAFVLYERELGGMLADEDDLEIGPRLCLSASLKVLTHVATAEEPVRFHLLLGHAGWAPGQLMTEIQAGAWIPAELDVDTVFGLPFEDRWAEEMQKQGINPAFVGTGSTQA